VETWLCSWPGMWPWPWGLWLGLGLEGCGLGLGLGLESCGLGLGLGGCGLVNITGAKFESIILFNFL